MRAETLVVFVCWVVCSAVIGACSACMIVLMNVCQSKPEARPES